MEQREPWTWWTYKLVQSWELEGLYDRTRSGSLLGVSTEEGNECAEAVCSHAHCSIFSGSSALSASQRCADNMDCIHNGML